MAAFEDFMNLDIRVGKIVSVEAVKKPTYTTHKLTVDFGNLVGKKYSLVCLVNYTKNQLINKLVVGVINLPPKKIGDAISEVLLLGTPDQNGACVLISPDSNNALVGQKVY
jgi:tRNA-binding protein